MTRKLTADQEMSFAIDVICRLENGEPWADAISAIPDDIHHSTAHKLRRMAWSMANNYGGFELPAFP